MGDYGKSDTVPHAIAYTDWKTHSSGKTINTQLAVKEAIRTAHPHSKITVIAIRVCDLDGFAQAGHASVALTVEYDSHLVERVYKAPSNRLQGGYGTLGTKVKFGHHELEWQGHKWEYYIAQWREKYDQIKYCYLVSPGDRKQEEVDELLLEASKWTSELHNEIYVFDDGDWEKNPKLWEAVQSASWDDVILDPIMKDTLISDVQNFFDSRALYEEYVVPWKRGIILHGTPGCGKTISIKALMNSLDKRDPPVASLYVKTLANCRGLHWSIREIFSQARTMAPCLLVFEDLDSLVVDKVRSYFLNEVDGLEDNNGILMIGSTNHLDRLDPGISKRPSRFDRKYHFKIPGERERILYCEYWKKKLEKNSNLDFDPAISAVVAKLTDGFSFAYLKELFVQTLLTIVGGRESELDDNEEELHKVQDSSEVHGGSANAHNVENSHTANPDETEPKAPSVDIPEELKNNPLMRVLRKQALALWKDMDNTKDEEAGVKKSHANGPAGTAGEEKAEGGDKDEGEKAEQDGNEEEEEDSDDDVDFRRQLRMLQRRNEERME